MYRLLVQSPFSYMLRCPYPSKHVTMVTTSVNVCNYSNYLCKNVTMVSGGAGPAMMPGPRKERNYMHRRRARNFDHAHIANCVRRYVPVCGFFLLVIIVLVSDFN